MANENVPAPALIRSDDQILPFNAWVPIGKSNYVLDLQKKQRNPIFRISVDILQNTNFFRAFTASAYVPAIYIQQFWNTLTYEAKTGAYSFQLDEKWFILDANLLIKALEITSIDQAHQFESPLSGDAIMEFVNELGYPGEIHFVSRMVMNHLYQPWRAILSMTNQCLTGKTSGYDRPRYSVLQMLWGIITRTNVDYAELIWEEFVQAIQTFLADKANLGIATKKDKKTKPYVIPYCQFTKLIICYLGRKHNINQRSGSPFNLAEDDHNLGNLKFVPKGEEDEVFGMQIPKELITDNIRNAPYYNAYLEMVAKHDHKIAAEEGGKKKSTSKADQSKKPATAKQSKPVSSMGKVRKVRKGKSPLKLINEEEEVHHEPEPQDEGEEYDIERAIQMSLESFSAPVGGVAFREPAASATHAITTRPSAQPEDDISANMVRESPSLADAKTGADVELSVSEADTEILSVGEDLQQGKEVSKTVTLEERTVDPDEGHARSEPSKLAESRPLPEHEVMKEDQAGSNPGLSHVALAGPDPEPMHDDFVATVYPQVHESLKHTTEEHVHLENPLSSSGTLSSMKNLDEMFGDQSFNGKPTEECGKGNVKTKVESMVTILIHQASSIAPPLSTPIINRSPPKPVATPVQEPIFTATRTTTTTTLPHPPPPHRVIKPNVVLSIKTYKRYGYTYLREIVLHRADYKEYKISEANFKNLHLNDFEDLYLLQLQGKLNHLFGADKVHLFNAVNPWIRNIVIRKRVEDLQLRIESYQTKLSLTRQNWDASDFLFKEDYTIFSDGTLTRVLDKLDHMVKYFKLFQYNPDMEIRIWSEDDKRRSEEFMEVIERRLKIRRIFRSLESFVSGRLRDVDYRLITRTK
ncbi:hypothetical protein Tco_0031918 [Tanacetum coccineum]